PLEEHALQAAARLASLVCPRNLARVEVAEQIAVRRRVGRCQSRCRRGYRSRGRRRKKCVTFAADGLRLRRRHLQPSCWFVAPVPPGVLCADLQRAEVARTQTIRSAFDGRSEEHTSELQSLAYLVCRLLLEKKKKI